MLLEADECSNATQWRGWMQQQRRLDSSDSGRCYFITDWCMALAVAQKGVNHGTCLQPLPARSTRGASGTDGVGFLSIRA